ncbi:DUF5643 domain-containing protein [Paenibacillus sp. FSL W8-0194]|uniref:DUF5643 domain-containing protein n=1 Tax=Paenibacillus sp. FSL W8-0194 TaxID=2921711 RepID=UPI0030DD5F9A
MKSIYKVMSAAVLASCVLGGAAWGTAYAAQAQATKSASGTVTQQDISLRVSKATYDGNVVQLEVERNGKGLVGGMTDWKWDDQKQESVQEKGAITSLELFINGISANAYGGSKLWERPNVTWQAGSGPDKALITMADATYLGDIASLKALPDNFKLTAKITLKGVNKPYTLNVPVQKNAGTVQKLNPNITKKSGKTSITFKKANVTSHSARLQLIVTGVDANTTMLYDFYDDQGRKIEQLSGGRGTDENGAKGVMYHDFFLDMQGKNIKSITIKPAKPVFEEPGATSGAFKVDDQGEVVMEYLKDLEMTAKIK